MNPGKVSEVTYKRAILKNLNSKNEGVMDVSSQFFSGLLFALQLLSGIYSGMTGWWTATSKTCGASSGATISKR